MLYILIVFFKLRFPAVQPSDILELHPEIEVCS